MNSANNNAIYICNTAYDNQLNERILERNVPSSNLDILYSFRPQQTKYTKLPVLDNTQCTNYNNNLPYDITQNFYPGTTNGPLSGFISKINDESILRNQIYALQKFPQANYTPSSKSDLYNNTISQNFNTNNNASQLFPGLFENSLEPNTINSNIKNLENLGNNLFNNHTRQQLKDS